MHVPIRLFTIATLFFFLSCGNAEVNSSEKIDQEPLSSTRDSLGIFEHNGVGIHYQDFGSGPLTLFFVHGWCINQSYWSEQIEFLRSDFRVVSLDVPGFGQSAGNRDAWTIEAFGQDIKALIDKLDLEKVILVGHSMGGDIILEAARDNPKVVALIGVDNFKDVGIVQEAEVQAQIDEFMDMLKVKFDEMVVGYAESALFHESTDSIVKHRVLNDFVSCDSAVAIACLEALFDYGPREAPQLSAIGQKLYLINSDATPTFRKGLDATGVQYEIIDVPATGHYPMIEKPEIFNEKLLEAIKKVQAEQKSDS